MSEPHVYGDLDALLDGELDAARRQQVEMHVASCAECAAALDRARRVARALADVPVPDPGDAYWARFAGRVESRLGQDEAPERETVTFYERLWRTLVPPGRWGWVGTAGVLVTATLAVYVGMRGYRPQPVPMREGTRRVQQAPAPTVTPAAPEREVAVPPSGAAPTPTAAPSAEAPGARAEAPVERTPQSAATETHFGRLAAVGAADSAPSQERASESAPATALEGEAEVLAAADPVLEFAHAALHGSPAEAQSRYAALARDDFAALPAPDAALLRAWNAPGDAHELRLEAPLAPLPAAKVPRPQGFADQKPALDTVRGGPVVAPAPPPAQLQILDALVWPRRDGAGGRDAVAALTQAWQRSAGGDARARARVRELATWLADSSPSGDERARWEALRNGAAEH